MGASSRMAGTIARTEREPTHTMATRKDLLKAHTFVSKRLVAALVDHDPDDVEHPLRRLGTGTFIGIMISVLVMAGFGVVGLIKPGNSSDWKTDKTIVIDSTAGTLMVFLQGKLYPVPNITSARLATGGNTVKSVKPKKLKGTPLEPAIGIADAPAQLPEPADLNGFPLRTCTVPPATGAADPSRLTTLEIGSGERPATPASFIAKADGASGAEYLVTEGRAYLMPNHEVSIKLGFGEDQRVRPGNAWLEAIPKGPTLNPLTFEAGDQSQNPVDGVDPNIGTLMEVRTAHGPGSYYVLLRDGLSQISPLESVVLQAEGAESVPISASQAGKALNPQKRHVGANGMPRAMPQPTPIADPEQSTLCATWPSADAPAEFTVDATAPPVTTQGPDARQADTVVMPSLTGALFRTAGTRGPDDPGTLVVDGKRYGIENTDAKTALGYGPVTPVAIPGELLSLIPAGLDPGRTLSIKDATHAL